MLRWIAAPVTAMDVEDVKAIIDAALRILQKVPMTIDGTDEFFGHLRDFGCEIAGKKVSFPQAVVDKTMTRIAEHKKANCIPLPDPDSEVTWSVSGQAIWIADTRDDHLRKCTREDLAVYSHVVDAIPGLGRSHPGFIPQDAPLKTQELHAFATIILNSKQPYRVSMFSPEMLPYYLRILEVVCGSREAAAEKARALLPSKVWVNTPMMISRESIEAPMLLRELTGQPLVFNPMPVAGIATPVTHAGALALITAEVLACNILGLAVDDRLMGWCSSPLFFDMKTGIHTNFGPETRLLHTGRTHIAKELFGHELSPTTPTSTAAKRPCAQSVLEKACQIAYNYALGMRHFGGLGTLATSDIVSTVQLMLDLEIVSIFRKSAAGFEVNAETLAEDLITKTAPEGARFMDTDHTAMHYREVSWFPEFLDRRVPMAWIKEPSNILEAARAKALNLEETAPNLCPLDEDQKEEIRRILSGADKELG